VYASHRPAKIALTQKKIANPATLRADGGKVSSNAFRRIHRSETNAAAIKDSLM